MSSIDNATANATKSATSWIDQVQFDERGLVPVIAQEVLTRKILMFAYMNQEALNETVRTQRAVYWSRSRNRLWRKGEESGHTQLVKDIRLDCDGDVILLKVEQRGGIACHTGRESCFFNRLEDQRWAVVEPVVQNPATIYKQST